MKNNLWLILFVLLFCFPSAQGARGATSIIAELSSDEIIQSHNFRHATILVSGTLKRGGDVIIEVYGPLATYRLWKKEKKFGIWVNGKSFLIPSVYSYHSLAASNAESALLKRLQNSFEEYLRSGISNVENDPENIKAQQAFHKIQYSKGFFISKVLPISLVNQTFMSFIHLPTATLSGKYTVKIHNVHKGKITETKYLFFTVHKDQVYSQLDDLASQQPSLYVGITVLITLLISFMISLLFKKF